MPIDHEHQQLETLAMRTWGEIVELCHNQGVRVPVGLHELMCKSLRDAFEAGGKTHMLRAVDRQAREAVVKYLRKLADMLDDDQVEYLSGGIVIDGIDHGKQIAIMSNLVLLKKSETTEVKPAPQPRIKIEHVDNGEGEHVPEISIDGDVMQPFNRGDAFLVGKSIHAATNGRPEGFDLWWSWLGWGEATRDKAERYWQRFAG